MPKFNHSSAAKSFMLNLTVNVNKRKEPVKTKSLTLFVIMLFSLDKHLLHGSQHPFSLTELS